MFNQLDINHTVLCSPQRRAIETAINVLNSYPNKEKLTIRLEPLLKEVTISADTIPLSKTELKEFVNKTSKASGIKIIYGDASLENDNWILNVLTNKEK